MYGKIIKTSFPILWMSFLFYLSNQPDTFYPKVFSWQGLAAHVFLYFVLSFLVSWASADYFRSNSKKIFVFSLLFSLFYGAADEFHQSFVPGRSMSFGDWMVDGFGAGIGALVFFRFFFSRKPKLLLHTCCIGCAVHAIELLKRKFRVVLFFYNPNIFPEREYVARLEEAKKIGKKLGLELIVGDYDHGEWLKAVKGHESDPEKGERCLICYEARLKAAAETAKSGKFDYFCATLTASPHKNAEAINKIGRALSEIFGVKFLEKDFKKNDGFRKACELSKKFNLYRQNYCGCEFSRRS